MPYPTKYTRQYDFQGYQVGNPTRPLPGDKVNADLNALKQSVEEIVDFLKGPIRSDGKLANGSVGVDQLNPNLNLGFSLPTVWEAHVDYTADSTVLYANKFWKSKAAHTSSGGFDESKWDEIVDFGAQADAAAASATDALASQNAAAASETAAAASASAASDSAAAASNSATAASGSATTATTQATAASDSATAAAGSETAAAGSAAAASGSADAAADSATAAAASAASITIASQAEAEAGTDNTKLMTPLRVAESIAANGGGGGESVSFASFNPTADGVTNDTTILNTAITAVSAVGGTLVIPPGDYAISDAVLKSNMHLQFMPGARFLQGSLGTSSSSVLYGTGTVGTGVALTANANSGTSSVTVASGGAAFAAGSYVLVYDDDYVFTPAVAGRNQEVLRVLSSDATTITFTAPLTTAFTTANSAKIAALTPLENLIISGDGDVVVGTNRAFGIRLQYPVNVNIKDGVTVRAPRAGGAYVFQTGFNSHIYRCSAYDGQTQTSGLGYAISFDESCTFCSVSYCHFENVRENTFTNRTRWCEFSHNMVVDIADSGWNCHGAGSDHNVCRDNIFKNCSQGVAVGWSGATRADSYNLVANNFLFNCSNGISVNTASSLTGIGNVVKGNVIEIVTGIGVYSNYQSKAVIDGNVVKRISGTVNCFYVNNSSDVVMENNTVSDAANAAGTSFRVDVSTDVLLKGNLAIRATGAAYYVPAGSTNVDLIGNAYQNADAQSIVGADSVKYNTWNT